MKLINDYKKSLQSLYDHVGFKEDWTVYAIDDRSEMFWQINIFRQVVKYAETMEQFNSEGDYYEDEIYTQRFYEKWVFRGVKLTMIIVDTRCDGNKFFAFFSNNKEVKQ